MPDPNEALLLEVIADIRTLLKKLCDNINGDTTYLQRVPSYGGGLKDGSNCSYHLTYSHGFYHLSYTDRHSLVVHEKFKTKEDAVKYYIMSSIFYQASLDSARKKEPACHHHRIFNRKRELTALISPEWERETIEDDKKTYQNYYDSYFKSCLEKGLTAEQAKQETEELYPPYIFD